MKGKRICSMLLAISLVAAMIPSVAPEVKALEEPETAYTSSEAIVFLGNNERELIAQSAASIGTNCEFDIVETWNFPSDENGEVCDYLSLVRSEFLSTEELIEYLVQLDGVLYAEPNYLIDIQEVSNDKYTDLQWWLADKGVNAPEVWHSGSAGNVPVVAVLDTGVDYTHPDLKGIMWTGNAYHGYDFANGDSDPMDDNGHGTQCAGIVAAAVNNGIGIAGICDQVQIMALKILDSNGKMASSSTILSAYTYMITQKNSGTNLVAANNSWGGLDISASLSLAVTSAGKAGIISVFAAGNSGKELTENKLLEGARPYSIHVAATDQSGKIASFSDYSSNYVDVAAPGADILTTNASVKVGYPMDIVKENALYFDSFEGYLRERSMVASVGGLEYSSEFYAKDGQETLKWTINGNAAEKQALMLLSWTDCRLADKDPSCMGIYFAMDSGTDNKVAVKVGITDTSGEQRYTLAAAVLETGYWSKLAFRVDKDILGRDVNINWNSAVVTIECMDYTMSTAPVSATVLIDGLAIYEEEYGQYEYASGTSMAAPIISGAVAALANYSTANGLGWSIDEIRARIISGIDSNSQPELLSKVISGGEFDLNAAISDLPKPYISSVEQEGELVVVKGRFFTDSTSVVFNGSEQVEVQRISDRELRFALPNHIKGGLYTVHVTNETDTSRAVIEIANRGYYLDIEGHWAINEIYYLIDSGIMNGISETEFSPNTQVTRAMFVTMLGRLSGVKEGDFEGNTQFEDVSSSDWYYEYVLWGQDCGIITGVSNTRFDPMGYISRQDMATMLLRYMNYRDVNLSFVDSGNEFTDESAVADYAYEAVKIVSAMELIKGYPDGSFAPNGNATRAEAATVISRLMLKVLA